MSEDTTIKSLFDHARKPPEGMDFLQTRYTVWATYVEHLANEPQKLGSGRRYADSVLYANGSLGLLADQKTLSGEMKLWRNVHFTPGVLGPLGNEQEEDAFADTATHITVLISVTDAGVATVQKMLNHKAFMGRPPRKLNAKYEHGMYVEKRPGELTSLSFRLGITSPLPL